MSHFPRTRDPLHQPPMQAITFAPPNQPPPDGSRFLVDSAHDSDKAESNIAFMKGPKRKRLAKACDACHKSKRRCDGTAPCSNCYFASKKCTYTDASGRPVPAPRPFKGDHPDVPADTRQSSHIVYSDGAQGSQSSFTSPAQQQGEVDTDDDIVSRKRFRPELVQPAPLETSGRSLAPPLLPSTERTLERDPALTRELVHLFFAHRQPQRMIIHEPSFHHALAHGLVPSHLLLAICALAAPLSQRSCFKEGRSRFAGEVFFQEAMSLMFDKDQNLICEKTLATAQALCLLQLHDRMAKSSWRGRYHEYALEVLEKLDVYRADNPILTPAPSLELIDASIERECTRRVFWLIYISDVLASVLYRRPIMANESQLKLRLPVDETSFLFTVHDSIPEYLDKPSPLSTSEIGQLIRVLSIHDKLEKTMDIFNNRESGIHPVNTLLDLEVKLNAWSESLPDSLRFTDENLAIHMSLFATNSNMGAWCFCTMHVIHCSCIFGLNQARQRCRTAMPGGPTWAHERLNRILTSLGDRAGKSVLLGSALWPLFKYCNADDPRLLEWSSKFEEVYGVRIQDLAPPPPDYIKDLRPPLPVQGRLQPGTAGSVGSSGSTPPPRNSLETAAPQIPSTYAPPGRTSTDSRFFNQPSFPDVRVHAHPPVASQPDLREKRNTAHDSSIDPALQVASNPTAQINQESLPAAALATSLPSLKSSGLLDWQRANEGGPPPTSANWPVSGQHRATVRQESRDATRSPFPSASHIDHSTATRPPASVASTSMPVGLPWLANESVSRLG